MSNRRYYRLLAEAERRAAQCALSAEACRLHIERAREFDWRADAEPYPDEHAAMPEGLPPGDLAR